MNTSKASQITPTRLSDAISVLHLDLWRSLVLKKCRQLSFPESKEYKLSILNQNVPSLMKTGNR